MRLSVADFTVAAHICDAFPLEGNANAPAAPTVTDWEPVLRSAEENAASPLLYASLKQRGCENGPAPDVIERLRIAYLRSDTANWLILQELQSLLSAFEQAQIPVVVLKGGALVTTLYPEPALRPMSDLDLLIPRAQFARAEALLIERGYASPVEMSEGYGPALTNYRAYERHGRNPAHVELHWHLFKSPYYCRRARVEWFWDQTIETYLCDQRARVFAPEAQFLHLASHFALHHRGEGLIWSYDLALMLARHRNRLDWELILGAAERFGLVPSLRLAADRVAETWGISIPSAASARLSGFRVRWQDRAAFALMTARREHARFMLDAFSQPSVARIAQFLIQHLFPAREYMRVRYSIRDERWLPLFYLRRMLDGSGKLLRSFVSMLTRDHSGA